MRPLSAWFLYLGLVLLVGAALAPWVYLGLNAGAGGTWLRPLAQQPFHRFVDRCLLGAALVGLWPLMRFLGLRTWRAVGWTSLRGQCPRLAGGFLFGLVSLGLVALGATLGGARSWNTDRAAMEVARHLLNAGLSAVVVALIEETLFRGCLFGSLRTQHRVLAAMVISSLIYAWVHFFLPVRWTEPVGPLTGFLVLGKMMSGMVIWTALIPGFLNLTLAGLILAVAFEATGTLYFSVGLHAGWIFWLKSYGFFTTEAAGANIWLWGTGRLVDGWVATVVLTLALVLIKWSLPTTLTLSEAPKPSSTPLEHP